MNQEPRYFLTAYGLARKHGFEGSEQEWLESLTAYAMAKRMGYEGTEEEWVSRLNDPVPAISIGPTVTLAAGKPAYVQISGTKEEPVLVFGIPRGEGLEDALMRTGGVMLGILSMGGYRVTDVGEPVLDSDAVNKKFADVIRNAADAAASAASDAKDVADSAAGVAAAALPKAGGTMGGAIDMGGHSIINASDPAGDTDVVNKRYAEDLVDSRYLAKQVSVPASGWTGDGPYSQTISVPGVMASDRPHICLIPADDVTIAEEQDAAWGCVSRGVANDGTVVFTCYESKPEINITLQIEVNR